MGFRNYFRKYYFNFLNTSSLRNSQKYKIQLFHAVFKNSQKYLEIENVLGIRTGFTKLEQG